MKTRLHTLSHFFSFFVKSRARDWLGPSRSAARPGSSCLGPPSPGGAWRRAHGAPHLARSPLPLACPSHSNSPSPAAPRRPDGNDSYPVRYRAGGGAPLARRPSYCHTDLYSSGHHIDIGLIGAPLTMSEQTLAAPLKGAPQLKTYTVQWDADHWNGKVVTAIGLEELKAAQLRELAYIAGSAEDGTEYDTVVPWTATIWEGKHDHYPDVEPVAAVVYWHYPTQYETPACPSAAGTHDWDSGHSHTCFRCGLRREHADPPVARVDGAPSEAPVDLYTYKKPHYYATWTEQPDAEPVLLSARDGDLRDALDDADEEAATGYEDTEHTVWVDYTVHACHCTTAGCTRGQGEVDESIPVGGGKRAVHPNPPPCPSGEHSWAALHELEGGLKENPGVQGHGGGVVLTRHCVHPDCSAIMVKDTWAHDPATGEQGLVQISYNEYDSVSLERKDALYRKDRED